MNSPNARSQQNRVSRSSPACKYRCQHGGIAIFGDRFQMDGSDFSGVISVAGALTLRGNLATG